VSCSSGTIACSTRCRPQDIGLPPEAQQIRIVRRASPREIVIETQYSETVNLPLFNHTFDFHPKATQPL